MKNTSKTTSLIRYVQNMLLVKINTIILLLHTIYMLFRKFSVFFVFLQGLFAFISPTHKLNFDLLGVEGHILFTNPMLSSVKMLQVEV